MVKKPKPERDPWAELNKLPNYWWILDEEHRPKAVSVREWAEWYEAAARKGVADGTPFDPRRVALTETATMRVSTVFLGLNHSFWGKGPPILFETMTFTLDKFPREFRGKIRFAADDLDTFRYSTWDDAETGHRATVRRIEKAEADALAGIKKMKKEPKDG